MSHTQPVSYDPFAQGELAAASPATEPQKELWVASLVGGDDANRAFNECLALDLRGQIDASAIRFALQGLVDRHETLRGTFSPDGNHFIVARQAKANLAEVDLTALPLEQREGKYRELAEREVRIPFDLHKGPLYRAHLLRMAADHFRLIFTAHHIACDGWSAGVLMLELSAMYRAVRESGSVSRAELPEVASYTQYAFAQKARAASQEGAEDVAYWLSHLSGELNPLNLPTDRPRQTERTYDAARIDLPLEGEALLGLRKVGAKAGCTLLVTFMGAMQALLQKITKQDDIILGVPSAGQAVTGEESLVGHCVHLLPIRCKIDEKKSFVEHLRTIKPEILSGFDHQQVTFSSLLPELKIQNDQSRIALVPVCVNIDVALTGMNFGGPAVDYETVPRAYESFELFINAVDFRDRLVLECSYNTSLFDEETIRRWVRQLKTLVVEIISSPDRPLEEISILDEEDRALITEMNATEVPRRGLPVHHLVSEQARKVPDQTALIFEEVELSYAELESKSNQIARLLMDKGVRRGDCVGVSVGRSERMVPALLGVLKTGAGYVPMDPTYPKDRTQAMADDANVRLVIGERAVLSSIPETEQQVLIDEEWTHLDRFDTSPVDVESSPADRAYVLFTSGSTGRPKGVDVPHRAFENILEALCKEPGFGPGEKQLALTTISFDIAGVELFCPLISGGVVVLCSAERAIDPQGLQALMERHHVNYMQATPATWAMLIAAGWKGRDDLSIGSAGEAFPPELLEPLTARARRGVWNLYGPTETTVYSSVKKLESGQPITIGRPLDNTQFYVLDERRQMVPVGAVGELWIGGMGVANGYIGRPELTAERFVPDPFVPDQKMYKTGDLARLSQTGDVECLGRTDFQVKIRGFRIELEEIETALASYPGVRRCVVSVSEVEKGDKRLVAYVVGLSPGEETERAVRSHLASKLSPYMVPQHVVCLEEFPLTANGKIDRKALPSPKKVSEARAEFSGPRTPVEETLYNIFREILDTENPGIDANFFELGGTSLHSIRVVDRINKHGMRATPAMLFQNPTVRKLAEAMATRSVESEESSLGSVVALRAHGDRTPLFLLHSLPGDLLGYGHLVHCLGEDQPCYGFHGLGKPDPTARSLRDLAVRYAANLQKFYPSGVVHLAGWCFGGTLALEVAHELRASGRQVGMVGLMETWPSRSKLGDRARSVSALLRGKAERLPSKRAIAKRLVMGEADPEVQVDAFLLEINSGPFAHRAEIYARNRVASDAHRSRSYDAPIALIRSSLVPDWSIREEDYGWSEFAKKVFVEKIPVEHNQVLKPPHVHQVAALLRTHMDKID